jgi:hypothetical protein
MEVASRAHGIIVEDILLKQDFKAIIAARPGICHGSPEY